MAASFGTVAFVGSTAAATAAAAGSTAATAAAAVTTLAGLLPAACAAVGVPELCRSARVPKAAARIPNPAPFRAPALLGQVTLCKEVEQAWALRSACGSEA